MRGQIVKITDEYQTNLYLTTTETVPVQVTGYKQQYLPSGGRKNVPVVRTEMQRLQMIIKPSQFNKALKRVKDINKPEGGEGTMKKMPRLWKWVIIYAPLAVLVWDVTLHLNLIGGWIASFALVQK